MKRSLFILVTIKKVEAHLRRMEFIASIIEKNYSVTKIVVEDQGKLRRFIDAMRIYKTIISQRPEIIYVIEPWIWATPKILRFFGVKKVIYQSGNVNYDVFRTLGKSKIIVFLMKFIEVSYIKNSNVIFSESVSLIKFFRALRQRNYVLYVPEEFDLMRYAFRPLISSHKKKEVNNAITIGFTAAIHKIQLYGKLVPRGWEIPQVINRLRTLSSQEFHAKIIGSGNGINLLEEEVRVSGFGDKIELYGFVSEDEKLDILSGCDVGFSEDYTNFLTHEYNLSHKIMEYMCLGLPVVSGNQGDKGQFIEKMKLCGRVIDPLEDNRIIDSEKYIDRIAFAVLDLINNKEAYETCRYNALQTASKFFDSRQISKLVLNVFTYLL